MTSSHDVINDIINVFSQLIQPSHVWARVLWASFCRLCIFARGFSRRNHIFFTISNFWWWRHNTSISQKSAVVLVILFKTFCYPLFLKIGLLGRQKLNVLPTLLHYYSYEVQKMAKKCAKNDDFWLKMAYWLCLMDVQCGNFF